jgi:hypothetical protein
MSLLTGLKESYRAFSDDGHASLVKTIARALQVIVAGVSFLVLAAWTVSPLRDFLLKTGYFDDKTVVAMLGITLALILSSLDDVFKRIQTIGKDVASLVPTQSKLVKRGVTDVYGPLLAELKTVPRRARTIDVLGLTLFTAWNQLEGWLSQPDAEGWKVTLLCLDPDFGAKAIPGIPSDWYEAAKSISTQIAAYDAAHRVELETRNIELIVLQYAAFPAIHGFRIGNGTLFISCTHWETAVDSLAKPYQFYDVFAASDQSERAEAYRSLFDNWFGHARAQSKQAWIPRGVVNPAAANPTTPAADSGNR